ncbi:hypothetical protein [Oryza sativa Japonica Group]|uniref:Uncharacterized protein n=1 Tax=Oryza sativa subsp. japonica TaxID=39947 RepID=Q5ZBI7_ORYSJ|nr:hypothetical protein [Oryza sativa Japonica Group]BAD61503.1 hypothetical protein [Oryza sativa Japonica Group]
MPLPPLAPPPPSRRRRRRLLCPATPEPASFAAGVGSGLEGARSGGGQALCLVPAASDVASSARAATAAAGGLLCRHLANAAWPTPLRLDLAAGGPDPLTATPALLPLAVGVAGAASTRRRPSACFPSGPQPPGVGGGRMPRRHRPCRCPALPAAAQAAARKIRDVIFWHKYIIVAEWELHNDGCAGAARGPC